MINKPRVLVAISIHKDALARLKEMADVDVTHPSTLQDKRSLLKIVGNYEGIISYGPQFDREIIGEARRLKVISCHSSARVDLNAASEHGIHITLTPTLFDTVADMTIALMLAAARMVPQAHIHIKNGLWRETTDKRFFSGIDVFGKTLGILGLGSIGAIVAKRVKGFDMRILYHDLIRKIELEEQLALEYQPLNQLLAEADFISIHIPLTKETRGLIGEEEFRVMKKSAILINTSRGPIIDEEALYRALKDRRIAAAGLDVFEDEPIKPENPLLALDNVVLTPHLGGSTKECDMLAVENAIQVLRGEKSPHQII